MKNWFLERKIQILLGFIGVVGVGYFMFFSNESSQNQLEIEQNQTMLDEKLLIESSPPEKAAHVEEVKVEMIMVDVKGAVAKPGVFEARSDERVKDLVARAGGLTSNADPNGVNLAAHIQDEMVIYVPLIGEDVVEIASPSGNNEEKSGKINLNSADEIELQELPGVGPSKAAAIIEYRNTNGFKSIEDLKNISGIGDKTFEKLKEFIIVK